MADLDPNALLALKDGIREGHVSFRFEGKLHGKVHVWVELEGKRQTNGGPWLIIMRTGDGRLVKKEFGHDEAEKELTDSLLTIHAWLTEDAPKS